MKQINEKDIKINIFGKISFAFINQFQLTLLVIILLIAIGISGLLNLPKESLPEIVFPSITIQTVFPGASPEDVEFLVTEKIENKVKEFDEINSVNSETMFGFSLVNIDYNEGVDIELKKIEIDNALKEINFTDGIIAPRSFIFTTSEIPLMNVAVSGNYSQDTLTYIAGDIANRIESIKGVDTVSISGGVKREIDVIVNELAMMENKLTFNDLRNVLVAQNFNAPVGELALNGVRYNLRIDERFKSIEDIKNTDITPGVMVSDVADVIDAVKMTDGFNRTYIRSVQSESEPSIFLTVSRKVNSDVIGTSRDIKNLIENEKGLLYPEDVTVSISNDLAINVSNDLDKIQSSAWSGLIVVIIVLFLFIGIKESLVVSITIPLSLLGTLGLLNLFNITFNTFAILGLIVALGLLVDNSIIVMENIDRLRKKGMSVSDAAFYGTNQVGYPIASSTLTTLAAFLPLAILPGILGAFISTIPITIMITISVSLLVSIMITPSIASKVLKLKSKVHMGKGLKTLTTTSLVAVLSFYAFYDGGRNQKLTLIMTVIFTTLMLLKNVFVGEKDIESTQFTKRYSELLTWIVTKKSRSVLVLIMGIIVLTGSILTFKTGLLKIAFFPKGEPTSLVINIDPVGGYTLEDTDMITREVEALLYDMPSVSQFTSTIGGQEVDYSKISIELDNNVQNGFDSLNDIDQELKRIPGAKFTIESQVSGPPVGKPIELKIVGENLDDSYILASEIIDQLELLQGVYNIETSSNSGVPQLLIDIDKNEALTYGVTALQIGNQLRGEISGVVATSVRLNQEQIDIIIRKDKDLIQNISGVENLFVATPVSEMLTLSSLSDLKEVFGTSNITRENGNRVIKITTDLRDSYNVNDVVKILKDSFEVSTLPKGIELQYSGDVAGIEQNFGNLFQSMILAVFLVFLILTLQFKSIGQPFIILTTIPMAVIGVIWGLIFTGNEFGFYAFMALVALVGIAVNDAIVLIDYTNFLRNEDVPIVEAISLAGKTRFSPVLATTLTTISGVLPLAFKESYYAQFSFALIFGLLMTTILTLIFIPTIYNLFTSRKRKVV